MKQYKSKFMEGHDMVYADKETIKNIYGMLEVMSSNDKTFKKPPFNQINNKIQVYDDGSFYIVAVGGKPEENLFASDHIKWYELEKY